MPEGYRAVPLFEVTPESPRVCLLAREEPDPVGGALVVLRHTPEARVLLGCLTDAGDRVIAWLELWFQSAGADVAGAVDSDKQWGRLLSAWEKSGGIGLQTGWEREHPKPCYLDLAAARVVYSDDVASDQAGSSDAWVPVNPDGGCLLVRPYHLLGYEEYVDVLGGAAWEGVAHGRSRVTMEEVGSVLASPDEPARMFLAAQGKRGRVVEALHLKLCAFEQAVQAVHAFASACQRPLFNLTGASFRVDLGQPGEGLPLLWTARVELVDPGEAVRLPVDTGGGGGFRRVGGGGPLVYSPQLVDAATQGEGVVRIRQCSGAGVLVVDGTFETEQLAEVSPKDLVRLQLSILGEGIDIYARLEADEALARGEWRFSSVATSPMTEQLAQGVRDAAGVPLRNSRFELLPLRSTPGDLYSMAVLGVRTLLVDGESTLATAMDELLSLARETGAAKASDLVSAVAGVFERDTRWAEVLGPQRVVLESIGAVEAFEYIPAGLWYETLAMLVRMLPGVSEHSTCRDYTDVTPKALHRVFDGALADASRLASASRGLIVTDWSRHHEVRDVLRAFSDRLK